jgi:hypothetical protein
VIGWMTAGSAAGEASWLSDTPVPATAANTGSFKEGGPGGNTRWWPPIETLIVMRAIGLVTCPRSAAVLCSRAMLVR